MKTIILARVSSKDQEDGQSIPSQVRRLTEYALKKNLKVVQTLQITESSTKETRKQFSEILAYIKQSKEPIALRNVIHLLLLPFCQLNLSTKSLLMRKQFRL
jgi:site-specific DNA recombinase